MRAVVVTINGLQPAYLGCYGCDWVPTPTFDHWAASGVVFDHHISDWPDLTAARRAWRFNPSSDSTTDLIADLRNAGVPSARVGPSLGPNDPFATGWGIPLTTKREAGPITLKSTRRAVRQVLEQWAEAPAALLWIDIDDLLPPWSVDDDGRDEFFDSEIDGEDGDADEVSARAGIEPWYGPVPDSIGPDDEGSFQRLQRTYAAAVASLDRALGRLWKDCDKAGWGDDALWLVTSPTGFPLGEHGAVGLARSDLHEELIHLPLLLRWPRDEFAGLRVSAFTQPPDIAATLRAVFGLAPTSDAAAGHSLVTLARGEAGPIRAHALSVLPGATGRQMCVRTPEWFLLGTDNSDTTRRLYVKPDDRWECNDVAQHHPETVAELEHVIRENLPSPAAR